MHVKLIKYKFSLWQHFCSCLYPCRSVSIQIDTLNFIHIICTLYIFINLFPESFNFSSTIIYSSKIFYIDKLWTTILLSINFLPLLYDNYYLLPLQAYGQWRLLTFLYVALFPAVYQEDNNCYRSLYS